MTAWCMCATATAIASRSSTRGAFKRNIPIPAVFRPSYTGNGTGGNVVFSRDPDQKYMFIGDFSNKLIRVFDRVSGKELSRFGRPGSHQIGGLARPHGIAGESKGNVYVGESLDGRRVQRFKPVARSVTQGWIAGSKED